MNRRTRNADGVRRSGRTTRVLAIAAAGTVALVGCGGGDDPEPIAQAAADDGSAGPATRPSPGQVSPVEAAGLARDPAITVIDVRTPEEYAAGHVADATLIDFYSESFVDDIAALDRDGRYLLYCRSGNRSGQTFALMEQLGFDQVYDLAGGLVGDGAGAIPLQR